MPLRPLLAASLAPSSISTLLYKTPSILAIRPPFPLSAWSDLLHNTAATVLTLVLPMTPVYLNPPPSPFPLVELKDEQNLQLFLSPQQADHPSFFNITTSQDQRAVLTEPEESKTFDHKVNEFMTHEGSRDRHASLSSSLQSAVDIHGAANGHVLSFGRKEDGDYESASDNNGSSVKWMSSKMRLMKKMMNSNCSSGSADDHNNPVSKFQHPMHDSDETNSFSKTNSIRVCSDCNTTTTPLWRSGPRGPKSLCNACGIRQRKARRAMEAAAAAAANGAAVATDATTSVKIKVHNKEKKSRSSHVAQYRKQFKAAPDYNSPPPPPHHHQSQKKLCFKEFALSLSKNSALQRVFPQDVEDAAILLMELSCGLLHS